jgi:hypothetical protein
MNLLNKFLVCGLMAFSGIASANVDAPHAFKTVSTDKLYVASAGEVMVTFLSKTAAYSNDLFLQGSANKILNNQTALEGQTFSLGSFQEGAELAFKILVNTSGDSFFSGLASNNKDNMIHTAYELNPNNTVTMGFEDILYGGDKDYDDIVFTLSNVKLADGAVAAVPEAQSYSMLLAGLFLFGVAKRRKS